MKRLVVLASGTGSNFENIVRACRQKIILAEVIGLISDKKSAGVLERARELNVPFTTLLIKDFATPSDWHNALEQQLRKLQPDFIVLAGYLRKIPSNILAQFPERIINIHPSLLPQYGGQGMYGHHVFEAVLAAGEKRTGVTVHLIDGEFDRGRILAQRELAIQSNETVQSLQKKIQQVEHQLYVEVLRELCAVTGES